MSEQEQQPDGSVEESEERLEDLEPGEEDADALRGGITPPDT